jgi:hypothetical protein
MAWFSSDKMTLILMPLFTIGLFNRLASGRYELPASLYSVAPLPVLRYLPLLPLGDHKKSRQGPAFAWHHVITFRSLLRTF